MSQFQVVVTLRLRCSHIAEVDKAGTTFGEDVNVQSGSAGVIARPVGDENEPEQHRLTRNQAERRDRVVRAALDLAAKGGYDAVQMRDVAAQAGVALGTVYRYFPSKDALLASATVEWMADLEAALQVHPPRGDTTSERIMDVLSRALRAVDREPQLARALIAALTAGDRTTADALQRSIESLARILRPAFPPDADPALEISVSKILGHVLWSTLICWASCTGDMDWVTGELAEAADLLV